MYSSDRISFINEYMSAYKSKIELANENGLFDSAKMFELFALEICKLFFKQNFYNLNTIKSNFPIFDLISEDEKIKATEKLSEIVKDITTETDVENLVKAKGFADCVAFISDGKISVAVQTKNGELTKQNVAQIRDIVLSKTAIDSQNIVVIEVK